MQVSLSHEELQALGTAITMVTQDGTTIAVPTHEGDLTGSPGAHTVTMVTADGTEAQQVCHGLHHPLKIQIIKNFQFIYIL